MPKSWETNLDPRTDYNQVKMPSYTPIECQIDIQFSFVWK